MNFEGKKGPGRRVVLPKHKANSGKARAKLAASKKRVPVVVELNWHEPKTRD